MINMFKMKNYRILKPAEEWADDGRMMWQTHPSGMKKNPARWQLRWCSETILIAQSRSQGFCMFCKNLLQRSVPCQQKRKLSVAPTSSAIFFAFWRQPWEIARTFCLSPQVRLGDGSGLLLKERGHTTWEWLGSLLQKCSWFTVATVVHCPKARRKPTTTTTAAATTTTRPTATQDSPSQYSGSPT